MNSISILVFVLLSGHHPEISAQIFTLEDIEVNRLGELAPKTMTNLQWVPNTNKLAYSEGSVLYIQDVTESKTWDTLLTLQVFNEICGLQGMKALNEFPELSFLSESEIHFRNGDSVVLFQLENTMTSTLLFDIPENAGNITFNPNMQFMAYTKGNNLYLANRSGNHSQITCDSMPGVVNGHVVYRHEFGMEKGIYWSANGNFLAYYRKDESGVSEYPIIDFRSRVAEYLPVRYPMAGMDSEITGVWVYEIKSGKNVRLELPVAEYTYHTNLSWSPDEKAILLQHLNRDQDHMSLRSYAIATGEMLEEILTESDKEYVEPLQPLIFAEKNQGSFYFQSARDGWNHLYYYDGAAKKLVQMTNGNWEVTGVSGYNRKEGKLYFTGTKDNPLERHFYSLEAGNKKIQKLSRIAGTHKVTLNSEKSLFIDDYSSFTTPHGIQVASLEDKDIGQELFQAENPLQDFRLGESVIGKIRSADKHTDLYYKMVLPVDFDSTRKYPVVFYVYGGPHIQLVKNSWYERVGYFGQYLAQHNVVFFIMDPRGTDGRGMEFEQIIHRQSGIPQMDDYLEGIEFLKSKSFIDQDRMGITGWSYGGYMTISMMLRHPGLFTAGVAGGPVTDWTLYEVMYGERYMDTPEQNPEGYEKTNLSKYAGDLKDDLLIIHGALDPVVVMQHSLLFMQACIENGSYIDFFVYPGHEHNVRGADRIHLTRMITNYFFDRFGYEHDQSAN